MGRLSNYELADRYKEKSELLGGVGVQFEYIGKDRIKLVGVRGDMEGRLEIPRFITDIGVCGPSIFLRLGPLYKARYSEIVIDGEYIQDIRNLCSGLYSEHVKLVIKNADKIRNMHGLFENSNNLRSIELEGTDTRNVEDIGHMFACCFKLKDLKVDKYLVWLKDGSYMFAYCKSLKRVELKGGKEIKDISGMFSGCKELEYLDISNFDVSNANTRYIIDDCDRLKEFKKPNLGELKDSSW